MWFDVRFGSKFIYLVYLPQLVFCVILYILTPVWRRLDERYHLRYGQGEDDDIEDIEPFVTYQLAELITTSYLEKLKDPQMRGAKNLKGL